MTTSASSHTSSHPVTKHRAIFISDVHLGTHGCQAELLLDFLRHNESEYLYLVGDIIDGWRLSKRWYWPSAHNVVIQKILRKARKGTKVIYIPGNHDEFLRQYVGLGIVLGDIQLLEETVHVAANGRRYLVLHGDRFDGVVRYHKGIAMLGSWAYDMVVILNGWFNSLRRRLGLPYWSLAAYLKRRVKDAVKFIVNFEESVVKDAKAQGMDGAICGHIHHPNTRLIEGIHYINDGDWVETGSAVVEDFEGNFSIVKWQPQDEQVKHVQRPRTH